jgi:hypothetical protein
MGLISSEETFNGRKGQTAEKVFYVFLREEGQ